MANTPNIDLEKLGAGSKLKDFPDMFNTDMEKIDSSLGYGFGRSTNPTVKAYVDDVNTKSSVYTAASGVSLLQLAFNDNVCPANSVKWINIRNCSTGDLPNSSAVYGMARVDRRVSTVARVDIYTDGGTHYFCSSSGTGSTWSAWDSFALDSKTPIREIVNVSGTTSGSGIIEITLTNTYAYAFCVTNVSKTLATPYSVTVDNFNNATHKMNLRIRNMGDNTAVANTTVEFDVMIIGT